MERGEISRGRRQPMKIIREVILKDLILNNLNKSIVLDRKLCRKFIYITDFI